MKKNTENEKHFFNSMAGKWDDICNHDKDKLDQIFSLIDIKPASKVMDVGCGTGVVLPRIFDAVGDGGKIVAVDFAEKMIKIASSKYKFSNLKFMCEDVSCLEFKNEYFDNVVCYSVFPHFIDKLKTLKHLCKALKVSGKIAICHSESRFQINKCHLEAGKEVCEDMLISADELSKLMIKAGFAIEHAIDNDDLYCVIGKKI